MARAKLGSIITDLAGSIGGITFQNSNAGIIVRNKPNFAGNFSTRRQLRRLHNYSLHQAWLSLSSTDRAMWQTFANFVNVKQKHSVYLNINGQQLFYQLNFYRLVYGFALITVPVFDAARPEPLNIYLSATPLTLTIHFDRTIDDTVEFVVLSLSAPISPAVNNFVNKCKIIPFVTATGTSQLITTEYEDIFGAIPTSGQTIGATFAVANISNALLTPFQTHRQNF